MSRKRKVEAYRISADEAGLDEVVIKGVIHVEAMSPGYYFVVLGSGPDERRFSVYRRGKQTAVIEQA